MNSRWRWIEFSRNRLRRHIYRSRYDRLCRVFVLRFHLSPRLLQTLQRDSIAQLRDANHGRIALPDKFPQSRQLVSSQSESIPNDLFVEIALEFKNDSADRYTRRPVVELALSFSHAHVAAFRIDTNVCAHSLVQSESLSTQSSINCVFGVLELFRGYSPVVVLHS